MKRVTKPTQIARISYSLSMADWFETLKTVIRNDHAAVLVTVIAVDGSAPREVGASLIVSTAETKGTIGGGNLEHTSIAHAVAMLNGNDVRVYRREHLGPGLGQCCGGRVELLFEQVTAKTEWYQSLTLSHGSELIDHWLCRRVDGVESLVVSQDELSRHFNAAASGRVAFLNKSVKDSSLWFCAPLATELPSVWVYGAGHVGQAVISQLSLLPCVVSLLDHREDWLERQPDLNISRVLTDSPEDEIPAATADTCHVVMTHSHTLDFDICHAILKQGGFSWLGLIGSATKRQTFINRLMQRGFDEAALTRLRCPIGSMSIRSSLPSVVALNLAAELTTHWDRTGTLRN